MRVALVLIDASVNVWFAILLLLMLRIVGCVISGTLVVDGDAEGSDKRAVMTQPSYAGGAASHPQLRLGALSSTPMWFRGPLIVGCAGMEASSHGLEPVRQPFSCSLSFVSLSCREIT